MELLKLENKGITIRSLTANKIQANQLTVNRPLVTDEIQAIRQ